MRTPAMLTGSAWLVLDSVLLCPAGYPAGECAKSMQAMAPSPAGEYGEYGDYSESYDEPQPDQERPFDCDMWYAALQIYDTCESPAWQSRLHSLLGLGLASAHLTIVQIGTCLRVAAVLRLESALIYCRGILGRLCS